MDSILLSEPLAVGNPRAAAVAHRSFSYHVPCPLLLPPGRRLVKVPTHRLLGFRRSLALAATGTLMANSVPEMGSGFIYKIPLLRDPKIHRKFQEAVGDFMTGREELLVVKPTTTVDEALDALVENRITGFPVIDDDWKLVGLVSDYDLLALDSILGGTPNDTSLFPEVDSSWKTFNEVQKLLSKTNGKLVGDLMTPAPVVVRETTNLEDAARILLETKYRRLPVVDADGKLVGIITRGNVVGAALKIKRASEMKA